MRPGGKSRGEPNTAASPMKEALEGFLRESGLAAAMKYPGIHDAWERIVGAEIAGRVRVSAFRRGTLEIAADSSAMLNDLQFHQAALLKDLQREVKRPHISRLAFVLDTDRKEDERKDERK